MNNVLLNLIQKMNYIGHHRRQEKLNILELDFLLLLLHETVVQKCLELSHFLKIYIWRLFVFSSSLAISAIFFPAKPVKCFIQGSGKEKLLFNHKLKLVFCHTFIQNLYTLSWIQSCCCLKW